MDLFLDLEMLNYKNGRCDMNSIIAIGLTSLNGNFNQEVKWLSEEQSMRKI
jgi:hypothetical protein